MTFAFDGLRTVESAYTSDPFLALAWLAGVPVVATAIEEYRRIHSQQQNAVGGSISGWE